MNLNQVMREWRWATKNSIRHIAKIIGTSAATLSRFERGEDIDGRTMAKIIKWLLS